MDNQLLAQAHVLKKTCGSSFDHLWRWVKRPSGLILLVGLFCLVVAIASLEESVTASPTDPSADCVNVMRSDGVSHWARVGCFAKDFGANWLHNIVELPALISAKCEAVAEDEAKEECEQRKSRRIVQLAKHAVLLVAGVVY